MAENYKHLYEQTKKMLAMYQDELIPGFRKTIEELEAKGKWISVNDRLPETKGFVLVCTENEFYKTRNVSKARYRNGEWRSNGGIWTNVTHWMPLPEPPKGE